MGSSVAVDTPSSFLNGWEEIAKYVGKGVRTVQRYERIGLPVRRLSGNAVGPVVAARREIDTWLNSANTQRERERERERERSARVVDTGRHELAALKHSIAQMQQLRQHTATLRAELHKTCELIRLIREQQIRACVRALQHRESRGDAS